MAISLLTGVAAALGYASPTAPRRGLIESAGQQTKVVLVPDLTVQEEHNDSMTITDHPVEKGTAAYISDHAYRMPAEVTIEYGFSPTGPGNKEVSSSYLTDIYTKALQIQSSRTLVDVYTGKRLYKNMLIMQIGLTTDNNTEHALFLRIGLREIILVTTQQLEVSTDPTKLALPQQSLGQQQMGSQQLQNAPLFDQANYVGIAGVG